VFVHKRLLLGMLSHLGEEAGVGALGDCVEGALEQLEDVHALVGYDCLLLKGAGVYRGGL
jgi:hypothetical protein